MAKKQKRIRRDDATKAAVLARAKIVGVTAAGREIGASGSIVSRWAAKAGIELPQFHFAPGKGVRRVDDDAAPGLGSGNPEPRQVTVTPPPANKNRAVRTEKNIAIAMAVIEGGHPAAVAETFGVTASHVYGVRQYLAPSIARERGIDYEPPPKHARTPKPDSTLHSRRAPEQLAMYAPPTTPPQRVTAQHARDEAEHAREQARTEMLESALRQALRERDAFKLVHEVTMRDKDPNASR